jgi:hypothetical protein
VRPSWILKACKLTQDLSMGKCYHSLLHLEQGFNSEGRTHQQPPIHSAYLGLQGRPISKTVTAPKRNIIYANCRFQRPKCSPKVEHVGFEDGLWIALLSPCSYNCATPSLSLILRGRPIPKTDIIYFSC